MKRNITTVRMPPKLHAEVEKLAYQKGISKNAVMIEALWAYIKLN